MTKCVNCKCPNCTGEIMAVLKTREGFTKSFSMPYPPQLYISIPKIPVFTAATNPVEISMSKIKLMKFYLYDATQTAAYYEEMSDD